MSEAKGTTKSSEQPTAGRIVHYGANLGLPKIVAMAALVVCVFEAAGKTRVTLRIFHPTGNDEVNLDAEYAETLTEGRWSWPRRA